MSHDPQARDLIRGAGARGGNGGPRGRGGHGAPCGHGGRGALGQ